MRKLVFTWSPERGVCDWQRLDANGNREGAPERAAPLAELREAAFGYELIWLAPGAELLAVTATLPVKGREKQLRALPYALEEQFAEDPDRMFFALPAETTAGATQTIAADGEWLGSALAALADEGITPARVLPDYLALPWVLESWTVLADAGTLYVRTDLAAGFTLEFETGWPVLARRLADLDEVGRPQYLRYIRGREPLGTPPVLDTVEEGLRSDPEPVTDGLFAVLPEGFARPAPMNLLQGRFKPGSEWRKALKPWLPAAGALAAVILLAVIGFAASWIQNAQADQALQKKLHQRFHQLMPNQPWPGKYQARRLIRRSLSGEANAGSADELLPLLTALAGANSGAITIESLNYRAGTLQIRLHAPDVSSLNALRSALATKSRLAVTIRSANQTDSGVEGALSVGKGAGS
ncbi:MAG: type II secretion system protein GspL [Gammaproteobacteria bacterium]